MIMERIHFDEVYKENLSNNLQKSLRMKLRSVSQKKNRDRIERFPEHCGIAKNVDDLNGK